MLTIDYELYGKALDNCDLSDEQKRAFIETLWSVIVSFVDLGFGVHPLQQAVQGCEQIEITKEVSLPAPCDMVELGDVGELDHQSKTDFRNAADGDGSPSRGRIR